ncbi:MAG: ATP-dependent zinc metalloprotease FtsH [Candidatus Dojkabacteria bacterium]|nr:MAG: ATP-dependent zinc metalloprotease FtsH [Candidatus Dojkabacteria bacterium]
MKKKSHQKKNDSKFKPLQVRGIGRVSNNRPWYKSPILWIFVITILSAFIFRFFVFQNTQQVDYATLIKTIKSQEYQKVQIQGQIVQIFPKNQEDKVIVGTIADPNSFREDLRLVNVDPETANIYFLQESNIDIFTIISVVLFALFIGLFGYSLISARNIASSGPIMGFGDTRAKLFVGEKQDIKFDQVKGIDEAVEEVKEIVNFLQNPEKYIKIGARIPKGVLLVGAPGTGKTLLARAIAGEAGVPFFFTSGSEFEEMLVGTGASRVRDLFNKAKDAAPAIIFIDEIDSIARKRGTVIYSGNTEQTLNQILVEMDGFDKNTNVIVIAATNRPDVLDPAILRPGRFDRRVVLDLPDIKGREEILKVHAANKPLATDIDLHIVAKRTIGFSGADLENMLNEAAIIAVKEGREEITYTDIEEAAIKVTVGPAKKRAKSEKMKKLTAYHEAGHAIAGYFMEEADRVHRISIVSRGYTGGVTMYLPNEDVEELKTEKKFFAELVVLYGGRTAEKLVFGDVSTGASSDIQRATKIARDMVKKYGMSTLGYIDFDDTEDSYVGRHVYSDRTAEQIDQEVRNILTQAQERCENILTAHRDSLDMIAGILIEKEVIEGDEFYQLMEGNARNKGDNEEDNKDK